MAAVSTSACRRAVLSIPSNFSRQYVEELEDLKIKVLSAISNLKKNQQTSQNLGKVILEPPSLTEKARLQEEKDALDKRIGGQFRKLIYYLADLKSLVRPACENYCHSDRMAYTGEMRRCIDRFLATELFFPIEKQYQSPSPLPGPEYCPPPIEELAERLLGFTDREMLPSCGEAKALEDLRKTIIEATPLANTNPEKFLKILEGELDKLSAGTESRHRLEVLHRTLEEFNRAVAQNEFQAAPGPVREKNKSLKEFSARLLEKIEIKRGGILREVFRAFLQNAPGFFHLINSYFEQIEQELIEQSSKSFTEGKIEKVNASAQLILSHLNLLSELLHSSDLAPEMRDPTRLASLAALQRRALGLTEAVEVYKDLAALYTTSLRGYGKDFGGQLEIYAQINKAASNLDARFSSIQARCQEAKEHLDRAIFPLMVMQVSQTQKEGDLLLAASPKDFAWILKAAAFVDSLQPVLQILQTSPNKEYVCQVQTVSVMIQNRIAEVQYQEHVAKPFEIENLDKTLVLLHAHVMAVNTLEGALPTIADFPDHQATFLSFIGHYVERKVELQKFLTNGIKGLISSFVSDLLKAKREGLSLKSAEIISLFNNIHFFTNGIKFDRDRIKECGCESVINEVSHLLWLKSFIADLSFLTAPVDETTSFDRFYLDMGKLDKIREEVSKDTYSSATKDHLLALLAETRSITSSIFSTYLQLALREIKLAFPRKELPPLASLLTYANGCFHQRFLAFQRMAPGEDRKKAGKTLIEMIDFLTFKLGPITKLILYKECLPTEFSTSLQTIRTQTDLILKQPLQTPSTAASSQLPFVPPSETLDEKISATGSPDELLVRVLPAGSPPSLAVAMVTNV